MSSIPGPPHRSRPAPAAHGSPPSSSSLVVLGLLIGALFVPCVGQSRLQAQDADVDPLQAEPELQPAWRTELELGFNGASGNSSFVVLRTGFSLTHLRTEIAEFELSGLYRYGKSEELVVARDWRTSIKVDLLPQDVWSPFLFATASADAVRRLDLRSEGGAGAKYTFWRGEPGSASVSLATLYSYENFSQEPALPPLPAQHSVRWSLRTRGETNIGRAGIRQTVFYQPLWDQSSDFLLEATTSLATQLVGDLTLAVEHEFFHDALPPPDVQRSDHKVSVVFRYAF